MNITTDKQGITLIVDNTENLILSLSKKNDELKQLLQKKMTSPTCVCLDEKNHNLYVSALNKHDEWVVFIYDYILLTGGRTLTENITKLDMVTVM